MFQDLISTSINEVADEFARIQSLDLNTGLDSTIEIRAKTLHLAIGLSGFIIFQSDKVPNEVRCLQSILILVLDSFS